MIGWNQRVTSNRLKAVSNAYVLAIEQERNNAMCKPVLKGGPEIFIFFRTPPKWIDEISSLVGYLQRQRGDHRSVWREDSAALQLLQFAELLLGVYI